MNKASQSTDTCVQLYGDTFHPSELTFLSEYSSRKIDYYDPRDLSPYRNVPYEMGLLSIHGADIEDLAPIAARIKAADPNVTEVHFVFGIFNSLQGNSEFTKREISLMASLGASSATSVYIQDD